MNLGTLITEAQRLAGRVDAEWNNRTRRWLNDALETWAMSIPWPTLKKEETFAATGDRALILPSRVAMVISMMDKTNSRSMNPAEYPDRETPTALAQATAGSAEVWRDMGLDAVVRQPVAGVLSFKTDTSDVFNVCVEGLAEDTTQSGRPDQYYVVREQVSMSSSGVHTGTQRFVRVDTLGKDDFTPSDVVVRDSSSNVLAHIPAFDYRSAYRRIELFHIPPAGTEFLVQYLHRPAPLVENYQVPHTSVDTEYLIWHAAGMIHEASGQADQSAIKKSRADETIQRRIYRERTHGRRDHRAMPEPGYWQLDDLDIP